MDLLKTEKSLPVLALNFKKVGQNVQNKLPNLLHQILKNFNPYQIMIFINIYDTIMNKQKLHQ